MNQCHICDLYFILIRSEWWNSWFNNVDILQIITSLKLYLPRWLIMVLTVCNDNDFSLHSRNWLQMINFIMGLLVNSQGICEEYLLSWICPSERKLILKELFLNSFVITCAIIQHSSMYTCIYLITKNQINLLNHSQFIIK